ncbi:hypothetical protein GCM10010439_17860 [Actinocorallia aurantiaca]|uniref:Uncharacterized protein n=1 Tax=Actinocorallia aurantiaca TaxID=46204 RepID=A0ABP6GGA7_9ACTN
MSCGGEDAAAQPETHAADHVRGETDTQVIRLMDIESQGPGPDSDDLSGPGLHKAQHASTLGTPPQTLRALRRFA